MNIKELNGKAIKKALNAKSAAFRYHNRNTRGGNFGINVRGVNGLDCEISGDYNVEGQITHLRFGRLFQCGIVIPERNFQYFMEMILRSTSNVQKMAVA